jgi:hypothetical protein
MSEEGRRRGGLVAAGASKRDKGGRFAGRVTPKPAARKPSAAVVVVKAPAPPRQPPSQRPRWEDRRLTAAEAAALLAVCPGVAETMP